MASELYPTRFLQPREVEATFCDGRAASFRYLGTTTEPRPEELQHRPWKLEPALDASTKKQAAGRGFVKEADATASARHAPALRPPHAANEASALFTA